MDKFGITVRISLFPPKGKNMKKWQDINLRNEILLKAKNLCAEHNAELLYLIFFGSALYGTDSENSDIDVRGVFIPDLNKTLLGESKNSICLHTGNSEHRNTSDDVDIDLWSVKHWIMDLLKKGDTGAIDLLFSYSNNECVIFKNPLMDEIFDNTSLLINQAASETAIQYSLGQAKKYGIKGSRLGFFKEIKNLMNSIIKNNCIDVRSSKLKDILSYLNYEFYGNKYYFINDDNINVGGKIHMNGIPLAEFISRIDSELNKYGDRAENALANNGVDFKALSHALRATGQHIELMRTGTIKYPLAFKDELLKVKTGQLPYLEVEEKILNDIEKMKQEPNIHNLCWNNDFAENIALKLLKTRETTANYNNIKMQISGEVEKLLNNIENEYNVKILLAVESGSRAWNMASNDSDYDIRFVYAHTKNWYLASCVKKMNDTINMGPLQNTFYGDIDAEGWDVTKAIDLFSKSNPSILEWLKSPVIYRKNENFAELMQNYSDETFNIVAMYYHYYSLGKKCWKEYLENHKLKNLCYAMRGMINALIVEKLQILPPLDISQAIQKIQPHLPEFGIEGNLDNEMKKIIARKQSGEKITGEAPKFFDDFFAIMLKHEFICKEWKKKTLSTPELFCETLKICGEI